MTVKRTAGGKFDPAAPFTYFVAGHAPNSAEEEHPNVLLAVNELTSRSHLDRLDRLCDSHKVMLDSGIFNLAMNHARAHSVTHDVALSLAPEEIDGFEELWDRYAMVANRFADRLWGVVELDQGGLANKPRTRQRIETELGFVPMPVYHPLLDGWDYYDELAAGYDRICFGNLVNANAGVRIRLIHAASERARKYPHLWTHLLGVFPNQNVLALPLRGSCDSSTWLQSVRWPFAWRAISLNKTVSPYVPGLWYTQQVREEYTTAALITAHNATFMQHGLAALAEDTHPWLAGGAR